MLLPDDRIFTRFEALPSTAAGYYPGVLIIEVGPAKGHYAVREENGRVANFNATNPAHNGLQKYPIHITEETLNDVVRCGNEDENAKCKLDHGSTVQDIVGSYTAFRRDGDKVRADLTLDSDLSGYKQANKLIQKFSKKIGNSIDFDYVYEISGDKAIARCIKLNSVDIVDTPAATKAFFSQKPSQSVQYTMLTPEDTATITNAITTAVQASEQRLQTNFSAAVDKAVKSRFEEEKKEDDEDEKKKKKDDDDKKDKEQMASLVATATLSAVKSLFPTMKVENLSGAAAVPAPVVTENAYVAKFKAAKELGLTDAGAIKHIAEHFPAIYNAQLASGGSTSVKL